MQLVTVADVKSVWISGPNLRKRWDNMPVSSFYNRLGKKAIPPPEYPFGPEKPYWRQATIEAFERKTEAVAG